MRLTKQIKELAQKEGFFVKVMKIEGTKRLHFSRIEGGINPRISDLPENLQAIAKSFSL